MAPNFDGTIDNRWRPGFESSLRRVKEEESDANQIPVIPSRELAVVPSRGRPTLEPHDRQTEALIRRFAAIERMPSGTAVSKLLDKWNWIDRMKTADEKQRFLEPLIAAARRDPEANEHVLIFLMLAFEPVRRGVSKEFVRVQSGLTPAVRDVNWSSRAEARMLNQIAREQLYDVTREAALEAVFRYPDPPPPRFFLWLRETIAHRALDKITAELPEPEAAGLTAAEAEAVQEALAGFTSVEGPRVSERSGMRAWRAQIEMRELFRVVDELYEHDAVRGVCRQAIGRLPRRQREVIEGYFFEERTVEQLAGSDGVSESTIYNHKAKAQKELERDDVFFTALQGLGHVRDAARKRALAERYPGGRLPDGRRLVSIDQAA